MTLVGVINTEHNVSVSAIHHEQGTIIHMCLSGYPISYETNTDIVSVILQCANERRHWALLIMIIVN